MKTSELIEHIGDKLTTFSSKDLLEIANDPKVSWSEYIDREIKVLNNYHADSGSDEVAQESIDRFNDMQALSYYVYKPVPVSKINGMTAKTNIMDLNCTRYELDRWQKFRAGDMTKEEARQELNLVQYALPLLTETEREFLITGFSAEEQKEVYDSLEDDNDLSLSDALTKVFEPKSE